MKKRCSISVALAALLSGFTYQTSAGDFYYDFSETFGGTAPASATTPWMRASFEAVAPNQVRLTVKNLNLTGEENIDQLYFNLNPALNFSSLSYSFEPGTGFSLPRIQIGEDQFKAGGDGRYDGKFTFSSGGSAADRFGAGETFVCLFTGAEGLSASDFAYLSTPVGSTPFYAAAHVQRIGASDSGWIDPVGGAKALVVPEPSTALVWVLGGVALVILRCWRSRF